MEYTEQELQRAKEIIEQEEIKQQFIKKKNEKIHSLDVMVRRMDNVACYVHISVGNYNFGMKDIEFNTQSEEGKILLTALKEIKDIINNKEF